MKPPAARLATQELTVLSYDWTAVNGAVHRPGDTVEWPTPSDSIGEVMEFTLETPHKPYLVEVNSFAQVGTTGIPTSERTVWSCDLGAGERCQMRKTDGDRLSLRVPGDAFAESGVYFTIQAYWAVPQKERSAEHPEVGEVTAVWLGRLRGRA